MVTRRRKTECSEKNQMELLGMKNTVSEMTFSWGKINIALDHTEEKNE
jgi:hypothetical protein